MSHPPPLGATPSLWLCFVLRFFQLRGHVPAQAPSFANGSQSMRDKSWDQGRPKAEGPACLLWGSRALALVSGLVPWWACHPGPAQGSLWRLSQLLFRSGFLLGIARGK